MSTQPPLIRNISDTALWAAIFRARENDRAKPLFRDPLARRLAGTRGEEIAHTLPERDQHEWAWITRTVLFDRFVMQEIQNGVDLVLNLAAGLDARPYRMDMPSGLRWVEVDLPDLLAYKEDVLAGEKPRCRLERVRLDLADVPARRELFQRLGRDSRKAMIITEGLLIYLSPEEVGLLAEDLAAPSSFQRWALDIGSPGLMKMLQQKLGTHLDRAGAPLRFAPPEGPGFFLPHGWEPIEIGSVLKTARQIGRLTLFMRLMSYFPESQGAQGSRPWSGICLMGRTKTG